MRIIKSLFISLLLISLVLGAIFLVGREAWLILAVSQVKGAVKALTEAERNAAIYYYKCRELGGSEAESFPSSYQLRFVDRAKYRLEVICQQFPTQPIVLGERQLPLFVRSSVGSSGLLLETLESRLNIELFGRKAAIVVRDKKITRESWQAELGQVPTTTCSGFGYSCCQTETSVGVGAAINAASDCPRTCFATCQSRPIVLSFTSQPFYDSATRSVTIAKGEEMIFSYVLDAGATGLQTGTLNFGDGQSTLVTSEQGTTSHKFNCSQSSCQYSVTLSATDNKDVESAMTGVTRIIVLVR